MDCESVEGQDLDMMGTVRWGGDNGDVNMKQAI